MSDLPRLSSSAQIPTNLQTEWVPVPEWGYQVLMSELTGGENDAYRAKMFKIDGTKLDLTMEGNSMRLVAAAMRDEYGNKIYQDLEEGVQDLAKKPSGGIERLAKVARRLSRLTDDDTKSMVGNSEPGRSDDSSSASPGISVAP